MEFLRELSYLKMYWGLEAAVFGGVTAFSLLTGTVTEKTANHKDVDEKLGWLEFRRRLPGYLTLGIMGLSWVGWNVFSVYYWGGEANGMLSSIMNFLTTPTEPTAVGSTRVLLAIDLFFIHMVRRLYESLSVPNPIQKFQAAVYFPMSTLSLIAEVQVMSRKQVLSPGQKFQAFAFYPLATLSLVAELFPLQQHTPLLELSDLRAVDLAAVGVFVLASVGSNKTFHQLAKLRRNRFGHVTNTAYKLPKGSMFEYICCPHYLAEILIYGSIAAILGTGSSTWLWLMGYVCWVWDTGTFFGDLFGFCSHKTFLKLQARLKEPPMDQRVFTNSASHL